MDQPTQTTSVAIGTSTRAAVSTTSKIMVSLGILAATGGFAAATIPLSSEIQSKTDTTGTVAGPLGALEYNPPLFNGLQRIEAQNITPAATLRSGYFIWEAGADVDGQGQLNPNVPLNYNLYAGTQQGLVNLNQAVWAMTATPGWATRTMRYLLTLPATVGPWYIMRARDPQGNQDQNTREVVWPASFSLTLTKAGTGTGTVTSAPAGINCGSDCSESYSAGTLVTLTASASAGSIFTGWSGAGCSGTGACGVTMNANAAVTAIFVPLRTLTVTKSGTGRGTVTSSPVGINCGSDCSEPYSDGTRVTMTATAASGSRFAGWSGACTGTTATCVVTMTAAKTATANFAPAYTKYPVVY